MYTELENILGNFSFLTLFVSMIFYWIQAILINKLKFKNLGYFFMIVSQFCLMSLLILRWKESGHFPLSNLYESLMFLSWSFTFLHIVLQQTTNNKFIGCITSPSALFTNAFATFSLPLEMQHSSPLVPALQSNWLMMHVTVMILSYAALILGSLLAVAFLVLTYGQNIDLQANTSNITFQNSFLISPNFLNISESNLIKLTKSIDNLSYRILGIGFPFLTIGILSGAVWANEAWGSYWSWDPKETWALLTWLIFAIYLHTRLTKGWKGKKPAIIASVGFITVWVCYLGVNLIGEGLHSYGWINFS